MSPPFEKPPPPIADDNSVRRRKLMTPRTALVFVFVLFAGVSAVQGQGNTCTYSYSAGKGDAYMSFCLTEYGTLASLQSPAGVEHLDTSNPLEGFAVCDTTDFTSVSEYVVPALGKGELPTVQQPKGAGRLPIIFTYRFVTSTVT